ncbi:MAG: inactive transglutaminase family protein [Nitrospirales bacterium]|nr:inactive transglutaminase family protein [Nitrospira sp.]MDR4502178.1 inactive transglutaminase family protein [Nitrospirales bacterium]
MNKRHLYILVLCLVSVGLGLFFFKVFVLHFPLTPQTQVELWIVEAHLTFFAKDKPVKVSLALPRNTRRYAIVDENFISQGYGLTTVKDEDNRRATWSIRNANGKQHLYYRATVRRVDVDSPHTDNESPQVLPPYFEGAQLTAVQAFVADIKEKSADTSTFIAELFSRLKHPNGDPNLQLLLGNDRSQEKKLQMASDILSFALIPNRVVHGVQLKGFQREAVIIHWLQIYDKGEWQFHDPETGRPDIPSHYFTWWHGTQPLTQIEGGDHFSITITIAPNQEEAIRAAMYHTQLATPHLLEFSLFSLPLEAQAVYRILLMVPMGALLLLILRNVIGIKTFGTFMPILMALAFRETQLVWGIVLFSLVVALGLAVRFYLEHLKLLLVPRLASLLIIVILLMAALSVISHKLGLERGLSVALFPMVILTMTIERMCIVWEERGALESIQQGLGSLAVASLTYIAMTIPYMEHLLFVFPELLLLFLAGTLLMGRYTGFRLLELRRFKALAQ